MTVATLVAGASMVGVGVWAFFAPESFSEFIDFAPYNEHLIHDVGAFQIGIGVATVLGLWVPDGLLVGLTGFVVASGLHTASHYLDRHHGGHDSDVPLLAVLTLVGLYAMVARLRRGRSPRRTAAR